MKENTRFTFQPPLEKEISDSFPDSLLDSVSPTAPQPITIPAPVDLSLFPQKAVESLAVTALQHQQKELLARLRVSLKKLESLEKQNQDLHRQNHRFEKTLYALRDQIYIYREKDQLHQKDQEKLQKQVQELQQNLLCAEKEYLELHGENREMAKLCRHYEKKLTLYRRYRHRIEIKVRPFINRLKNLVR